MIETAAQRHERLARTFEQRAANSRNPDVRQTYELMAAAERRERDALDN